MRFKYGPTGLVCLGVCRQRSNLSVVSGWVSIWASRSCLELKVLKQMGHGSSSSCPLLGACSSAPLSSTTCDTNNPSATHSCYSATQHQKRLILMTQTKNTGFVLLCNWHQSQVGSSTPSFVKNTGWFKHSKNTVKWQISPFCWQAHQPDLHRHHGWVSS